MSYQKRKKIIEKARTWSWKKGGMIVDITVFYQRDFRIEDANVRMDLSFQHSPHQLIKTTQIIK